MTVFKINPEKGDLWWGCTAAEEYKRNLRKNEEEGSDQRGPPTSSFSFGLIEESPSRIGEFLNQLKSGER
jgi:hypothetical protein